MSAKSSGFSVAAVIFFMEQEGLPPIDYIKIRKSTKQGEKKKERKLKQTIKPGSHIFFISLFSSMNN
jgi:hypothetical protein